MKDSFVQGLNNIKDRQAIFISPNSWILSSEIVLGITLGLSELREPILVQWLQDIFSEGLQHKEVPSFLRLVYLYGLLLLGYEFAPDKNIVTDYLDGDAPIEEFALRIWIVRHYPEGTVCCYYRKLDKRVKKQNFLKKQ